MSRLPLRLLLLALLAAVLALSLAVSSSAHRYPTKTPCAKRILHAGHPGPLRCLRAAQWLLGAHDPAVRRGAYWQAYKGPLRTRYGPQTRAAVSRTKFRLGYPRAEVDGTFGPRLRAILLGRAKVPLAYAVRATKRRTALTERRCYGSSTMIKYLRAEVGVREVPIGSNDGPRVRVYQSVTGAYRAPWCVSFVQYIIRRARVYGSIAPGVGGVIANGSAGVFYVVGWARNRGWLRSRPLPGDLVAFMDRLGHIGMIESVGRSGYTSVEGNASDQVLRRYHPYGGRRVVFVRIPGASVRYRCR